MTKFRRFKAWLKGHKVIVCPKCHKDFLHHEKYQHIKIGKINYRFICRDCYENKC